MKKIPSGLILSAIAVAQLAAAAAHAQTPPPAAQPAYPPAPAAQPAYPPPPAYPPQPAYPPTGYPPPPPYGTYPPVYGTPGAFPGAPPVPPGGGPTVRLFADNPRARLQQMTLRWQDVCITPCGTPVDPNGTFRVGGGSVTPSPSFRMPRPNGEVVLKANTGSTVKHWVGFGLGMGGVAAAAVGGLYLLAGHSTNNTDAFGDTVVSDTYKTVGIVYLVTGAILMAIGFPLWASQSTSVDVK